MSWAAMVLFLANLPAEAESALTSTTAAERAHKGTGTLRASSHL